ncbi:13365_t:CDS:10 [Ambispora gerdemannii]|uniref:proteasome endopeptidase complex n=1 Tax=Ambispora gerdemannii TaxID=144530 RepID=A0A9N8VMX8_9GLOM|nr:13365_t:CDS:10 [Ambispora gerdemannii]
MSLKPGEVDLGTSIMAIEIANGVIIGADSRTTAGTFIMNRVTDKLTELHDRIYCCRSGSAADTQALADIIRYYLQMFTVHHGEVPTVSVAGSLFQELCYTNKDSLSAGIIIAGWDKYHGGTVYNIPLGGGIFKQQYAISEYRQGMTKEEGIKFVKHAITLAIGRDNKSGGCVRVAIITEEGVERLFYPGDTLQTFRFVKKFAKTGRFTRLFNSTPTTNAEQDFISELAKNDNVEQNKTAEPKQQESVKAAAPIKDWKQTMLEATGKTEVKLPQTPRVLPVSTSEQTNLPKENKEQVEPIIRKTVDKRGTSPLSQLARVRERPTTRLEAVPNNAIAINRKAISRFVMISRLPLTTIPGDIRSLASNVKIEWAQSIQEICLWRNEFYRFIGKVAVNFITPLAAERFVRTNLDSYLAGQKIINRNEELVSRPGTQVQLFGLPAIVNQFQVDQALAGYDIIDRKKTGIRLLRSPDREATTKWLIKLETKREAHRLVRDADNNFLPVPLGFEYIVHASIDSNYEYGNHEYT